VNFSYVDLTCAVDEIVHHADQ